MNTISRTTSSSDNFVGYHSTEGMGYKLKPSSPYFFLSRKSRNFLERAIGSNVWMIGGTRDSRDCMIYHLVGRFMPSEIRNDQNDPSLHIVFGESGMALQPPVVLNDLDWFLELYRSQNRFSFGFNSIRGELIIAGLNSIISKNDA